MPVLYRAFDLVIDSPLPLPEALPLSLGEADVEVSFGTVDTTAFLRPGSHLKPGDWWQASPSEQHLLFGCAAGVYEIKDGKRITIDALPGATEEKIRVFLLGSAMGAIQIQLGRIPVHGGAIVSGGKAIIITGEQGAGKSTMTSALVHNGFPYLTDDVSSITFKGDSMLVLPAYPQRKLVVDACIQLGYDPQTLPIADASRDKFAIRDRDRWCDQAKPAHMLVELVPAEKGQALSAQPITGHSQLELMMRSMYRIRMHMKGGGLAPHMFKSILTVAANLEMFRVFIPRGINNISGIASELAHVLKLHPSWPTASAERKEMGQNAH